MGKIYGTGTGIDLGQIFKPSGKQPVDDRMVVDSKASLTTAFGTSSNNTAYKGMTVSVVNASNHTEDALYQLIGSDPTVLSNWSRIGAPIPDNTVKIVTKSSSKTVTYNDVWFGSKS